MLLPNFVWGLSSLAVARAAVTVYGQIPLAQTSTASGPAATPPLAAYDDTVLLPPDIPQGDQKPGTAFTLELQQNRNNMFGASIPQRGDFYGFSIEMSVINQVLGKNSTHLHPTFLNLMGNIQQRAGAVRVRLGGNTQERAAMIDHLPDGRVIAKGDPLSGTTTGTPDVVYTVDLIYMAANVSSHVNVQWFLGIPFNDTVNWRLQIAEQGQAILGDHLLGLQAGNEPDLYARHGRRAPTYTPFDYFGEFGDLIQVVGNNPNIPRKNILIGPSIASADWVPEMVWDTGYLEAYAEHLSIITVENYPNNNCFAQFGVGAERFPQIEFPTYLTHNSPVERCRQYLNSTAIAQRFNKPFMMFETNTASCGGFPGISDSYGAALWALDYGMQMAYSNFTGALLHVGGQNVYYNPFTSPPTNQSTFNEWTVGAVYYSALIISEVFGNTNTSRIIDLFGNGGNQFTPQYAIYENDNLARVALFNYVTDPSGASDYVATIAVAGGAVPASVRVKYFEAESVSQRTNLTWAGQTMGNRFEADGRLKGELNVVTINCDVGANRCNIPVQAPGFALVFLSDAPQLSIGESTITFETTAHTKTINTATVDPSVLATSNGKSEKDRAVMGSTSKGSVSGATGLRAFVPGLTVLVSMVAGGAFVLMSLTR